MGKTIAQGGTMLNHVVLKTIQSICESISTVDFTGTDASDFKEKTPEQGIGTW